MNNGEAEVSVDIAGVKYASGGVTVSATGNISARHGWEEVLYWQTKSRPIKRNARTFTRARFVSAGRARRVERPWDPKVPRKSR